MVKSTARVALHTSPAQPCHQNWNPFSILPHEIRHWITAEPWSPVWRENTVPVLHRPLSERLELVMQKTLSLTVIGDNDHLVVCCRLISPGLPVLRLFLGVCL